jgi:2-polyprenyl-3-methyl-5-hydroxy-6-metoxy-1,4-benzoquinol methylase
MNFSPIFKGFKRAIPREPEIQVLRKEDEYREATKHIMQLGLTGHHDPQKNWDLWLSINISRVLNKKSNILDAGSGARAVFANSMAELGYRNSYACDFQRAKGKKIISSIQDISRTNYDNSFFDFIACHSVIEHGVNLVDFLSEMYRIAKPGGMLAVSTDFWPIHEDHSDKFPYGLENPPMMLFDNETTKALLLTAEEVGWKVPQFNAITDLTIRPVYWPRMDSWFTFFWLLLTK